MNIKIAIKTWLTGKGQGRGLDTLSRLCCGLVETVTLNEIPLAAPPRLMPVQIRAEARFEPRIHFRRPQLDSLHDVGGFARIETALRRRRNHPT